MNIRCKGNGRRLVHGTLGTLAVAALMLGSGSTEALAHGKKYQKHHKGHGARHERVYVQPVPAPPMHVAVHRPIVAPRVLVVRDVDLYRPYYHTQVYFTPHRHHHVMYRFPVATPYGVVYQPYAYCDGHLFDGYDVRDDDDRVDGYVQFSTPNLHVGFGF